MQKPGDPILVIGAGGAGLIAAWKAALSGARVVVHERNAKPGIKLLISGGGKCNVTHSGPMEDVRSAFRRREDRFLKHAFFRFTNDAICRLLAEQGVETAARPDGRVFPVSGRASDAANALVNAVRSAGGEIRLHSRVEKILTHQNAVTGARIDGNNISARHLILATGGASYRKTGTTGDGFAWGRELGHTIVPIRPALAPMHLSPPHPRAWQGVAIREGQLDVYARGKKIDSWKGDILFTHEGLSGPAALEVSRAAAAALAEGEVRLRFDFFPERDFPLLDDDLGAIVRAHGGKTICTILEAWLPNRIVPDLLAFCQVDPQQRGHALTREERRSIVRLLKEWDLGEVDRVDVDRGEVTAGGISLDEVDPATMRSRKIAGLYVAGEVLDIAGPVGGYNLQAAFSTGFVAGESAAKAWMELYPH